MHERFEIYIRDNEDAFIKNAEKSPVEFKTDTFDDIFYERCKLYERYGISEQR